MIREDYGHFQVALVPRSAVSRSAEWLSDCTFMGYADKHWDQDSRHQRTELDNLKGLQYIVGWAEQAHGGWMGYARDDQGSIHRVGCVRAYQGDAIRAARSLVVMLREQQILNRHLYPDAYRVKRAA